MPVIAPSSYENQKAGGALENAAEEILNGIFCHYEPPTSTKAQKTAAIAVRKNPTKFLYDEQPTKPLLKKKAVSTPNSVDHYETGSEYDTETDIGEYEDEDPQEETLFKVKPETPSKRGIKWRDEESKRIEEEKEQAKATSSWSQCMTLPCFTDGQDLPGTLEDIQDENEVPQEPTPVGAATPTKSALKKSDDGVMKVLYDDQGNPNTTPRSPGSIRNHSFFRNVTNSPKAQAYSPRAQFYEPKDYNKPSTPKATEFKMPRQYTPRGPKLPGPPSEVGGPSPANVELPAPPTPKRVIPPSPMQVAPIPGSSGNSDYDFAKSIAEPPSRIRQIGPLPGSPGIKDKRGGPEVIRLAKIGRTPGQAPQPLTEAQMIKEHWNGVDPAKAQTGTYVAKSPKSYMAPVVAPSQQQLVHAEIEEPAQISVLEAVQMLNKAGFNPGRRFNRGYNPKSFKKTVKAKAPKSPSTHHHGYATANDNRDSFLEGEQKPSFVGTRRVAAPASQPSNSALLKEIKQSRAPTLALETNDLSDEMTRDPTPRQMKIQELEENLRHKGSALPPTPRRKQPESEVCPTPTAQKPPQHFVPADSGATDQAYKKPKPAAARKEKKKEAPTKNETSLLPKKEAKKEEKAPKKKTSQSSSRPRSQPQSGSTTQNKKKKEKKGFMSGIKKGLGKLKNTVNEIDSQRIAEPTPTRKRREVRMA